jgi:hypothetical protein
MKNMSFPPVVFEKFLNLKQKNWKISPVSLAFFRIKKKPNLPFGKLSFFFKYLSLKIKPRNDFQYNIRQSRHKAISELP